MIAPTFVDVEEELDKRAMGDLLKQMERQVIEDK
jgi:hypothetical protein